MPRTRRAKPELTESWDDVDTENDFDGKIYAEEDEIDEMGSSYNASRSPKSRVSTAKDEDEDGDTDATRRPARQGLRNGHVAATPEEKNKNRAPSRRSESSVVEQEFIMPSSPNALRNRSSAKARTQTPRFRLNERSMTSDAGHMRRKPEAGSRLRNTVDREEAPAAGSDYLGIGYQRIFSPAVSWAVDIIGIAVNNPILKYAVAMWLLVGVAIFANNFVNNTITQALSPICRVPGVSWLGLSFCPESPAAELTGPAEFDKLMHAQSQFQEVLASTANGAMLPLDMKRSEASIRDLRQVVQYSSLPSRNELVFEFGGFVDTARQASQDLSKFNTRIGNAVDRILTTNRWTLQVIEGVAEEDAARGSIAKFFASNLNVFAPFQPVPLSRDVLLDQYLRHTSAVEEQVMSLIGEAQVLLNVLDNLDGRLDVIAGIAMRDGISVEENKEAMFATLWTKLGGNRNSVAKLNHQLKLLREVGEYRRLAWAHVAGTIVKLQAIRDQLEDLRERVALPEIVGDKVPLEVHIENINLGIERLEMERDNSRRLADENHARILSRAEQADRLIDSRAA